MKTHIFKEDLSIMYIDAKTFPDDIFIAHQALLSFFKDKKNREFFGVFFSTKTGKTQYKAAVMESFKGEGARLGLETHQLKKGSYNYIAIPEHKNNAPAIKILLMRATADIKGMEQDTDADKNPKIVKILV